MPGVRLTCEDVSSMARAGRRSLAQEGVLCDPSVILGQSDKLTLLSTETHRLLGISAGQPMYAPMDMRRSTSIKRVESAIPDTTARDQLVPNSVALYGLPLAGYAARCQAVSSRTRTVDHTSITHPGGLGCFHDTLFRRSGSVLLSHEAGLPPAGRQIGKYERNRRCRIVSRGNNRYAFCSLQQQGARPRCRAVPSRVVGYRNRRSHMDHTITHTLIRWTGGIVVVVGACRPLSGHSPIRPLGGESFSARWRQPWHARWRRHALDAR